MSTLSCVRNLGDPGKVKGMFKPQSSFTTRSGAFFFWKSDGPVVAMKGGNAPGAKGVTEFGPQTLTFTEDTEP
jgi:hypothetical protein